MGFADFFGCEWTDLGGGRFRGGVFGRGDLKFMILKVLSERPMHGYDVMRELERQANGLYRASPGSVYPTLQMLEDEGFLTSEQEGGKKIYAVTDEGRAYLESHEEKVERIDERIRDAKERFFGQEMENLMESFSRLAESTFEGAFRWTEDTDFMGHVREILDNASGRVEEARQAAREARKAARDAGRAARAAAREAARGAKEAAWDAAREAKDAARRAREAAEDARRAHRNAATATAESGANPERGHDDTTEGNPTSGEQGSHGASGPDPA